MYKRIFSIDLALTLGAGYSLTAFSQAKPETLVKRQAVHSPFVKKRVLN